MRHALPPLLALVLLFGCGQHEESHDAAPASSQPAAAGVRTVELACAGCVFHMEDAKGCEAAVKIDGKPMKITGVPFDAHAEGICGASKQAEVSGQVVDGKYVATSLKVLP
jgi:hypothetical protein